MAAQEYYNPNNTFDSTTQPVPVPIYPRIPQSQYHSPPQYEPYSQSLPSGNQLPPRYTPDFQHNYSHEAQAAQRPPSPYRPQPIAPQRYHSHPPPPIHQYNPPHSPRLEPLSPQRSYSEPPSPQEHRHHNHRHHTHRSRSSSRSPSPSRSRDLHHKEKGDHPHKNSNTFLGALGGGVIGDLIFPGLGTLGGLIIGGIGGHEAGRHNKDHKEHRVIRDRYQEEYEEGKRRRHEL